MKLQDILKERGSWGIYGYRRSDTKDKEPKPFKDDSKDAAISERVAEEVVNNYPHLIEKRRIKRLHLQMIIGKICRHMPQMQLPDFDNVAEYLRKNHRIKVK